MDIDTDDDFALDFALDFAGMLLDPPGTRPVRRGIEVDKTDARLAEQVRSAPFRAEALGLT